MSWCCCWDNGTEPEAVAVRVRGKKVCRSVGDTANIEVTM